MVFSKTGRFLSKAEILGVGVLSPPFELSQCHKEGPRFQHRPLDYVAILDVRARQHAKASLPLGGGGAAAAVLPLTSQVVAAGGDRNY